MTGLSVETAEQLQTQNYGIGGHYVPHWDFRIKTEINFEGGTGNRIATVLFYVNSILMETKIAF
jgi:prolyl 4-hydroxylase